MISFERKIYNLKRQHFHTHTHIHTHTHTHTHIYIYIYMQFYYLYEKSFHIICMQMFLGPMLEKSEQRSENYSVSY